MSLYRRYRPTVFADVAGQEHIKRTLQQEIADGSLVHAYIFTGPRAVGKTTTARIFARAINCKVRKKGDSEPCNACDACTMILENKTLDIIEVDAASQTGIDNIRENIISVARVANTYLKYKVFIIDEVHMLSSHSFNALLKLIEEPPARVVFILATTEIRKVLATIISRCQRFDFKRIPAAAMEARLKKLATLEGKTVDDSVIHDVIRFSGGCQRDAESLLGQLLGLHPSHIDREMASLVFPQSSEKCVHELVHALAGKDAKKGIEIINLLIEEGVDLTAFTNDVIDYFRDILLIRQGVESLLDRPGKQIEDQKVLAKSLESDRILGIIDIFTTVHKDSRWFTIPQLPLEMAVVKCCQ